MRKNTPNAMFSSHLTKADDGNGQQQAAQLRQQSETVMPDANSLCWARCHWTASVTTPDDRRGTPAAKLSISPAIHPSQVLLFFVFFCLEH
jgi:hypothetical protein